MYDKLAGVSTLEETTELLGYLERILHFTRGIPTLRVRLELQKMLRELIKKTSKRLDRMKHERPKSEKQLSLKDRDFN